MKILHTGDLHLDSAFCSSDVFGAEDRREAQRRCLGRIFELAKKEECKMILIAGDLFDGRYITAETKKYVNKLFSETEMPIVIAPGNHDPYVDGSFYKSGELPENVYVFSSSELQRFDFPDLNLKVYGYAFTSQSISESPLMSAEREDDGLISVLCAHADLFAPVSKYSPVTLGDIRKLGVDYAALGHVHNSCDTGSDAVRYCSFAEGRSFDEIGEGGVLIVDISPDRALSVRREVVSRTRYEIRDVNVDGCDSADAVLSAVRSVADDIKYDGDVNLRVYLYGAVYGDILADTDDLERRLCRSGIRVEIKDMTFPVASVEDLRADPSIKGAFYAALYPQLIHDDPATRRTAALALRIGLAAIDGKRILGGKNTDEDM